MTDVGATINKGDLIPEDVTQVVDCAGESWSRSGNKWQLTNTTMGLEYRALSVLQYAPLTVTAVREPERKVERAGWPEDEVVHYRIPGDASPLTLCGLDVWADDTSVTERAGSSNCPACREAADEDKSEPELPPDVDELSLLALVRLHGEERRQEGYTLANPADGMDVVYRHGEAAQALFDRIAALVPQQPVQARDNQGDALWIHGCGHVTAITPVDVGILGDLIDHRDCRTGVDGPWRPLLVGGNPAPEQSSAPDFLAAVNKLTIERDELRRSRDFLTEQVVKPAREALDSVGIEGGVKLMDRILLLANQRDEARARVSDLLATVAASENASALVELRAERDEARVEVRHLKAELAGTEQMLKVALGDPSVLSLPQVPRKNITLVGAKGTRFVPVGAVSWCAEVEGGCCFGLGELIDLAGPLSMVMREPRTWPRLDAVPEGLRRVEVRQPDGMQFTATRRQDDRWAGDIASGGNAEALEPFECYTWGELLGEGDVTEVFE